MNVAGPNALVGMAYRRDFHCAHFVQHVQRVLFGREVRLPGGGPRNPAAAAADWGLSPATAPKDGDLVLMFEMGRPRADHVGVFFRLDHEDWCLHLPDRPSGSVLHRMRDLPGFGLRIEGVYAWA